MRLPVLLLLAAATLPAQRSRPATPPAPFRTTDAQATAALTPLTWRNIGPANMAGRISHIAAVESDPATVYVAAASGGVFKSTNAGTTWSQVFGNYGSASIGAIAIHQRNPNIVWIGTGEGCVRNSVAWGDGIYKSTDGGRTFTHMGLPETHIIDEIITHPTNPDIVWVAAQGHLWGYNAERGIFKTTDGGRTWRRIIRGLPADDRTGASALDIDPSNPDVLYAGMWERLREPHNFTSGGPNGGIYKSTDGGESWAKLTTGLPTGPTGKIGLDVYAKDPRILVAIVEHSARQATGGRGGRGGGAASAPVDTTSLGTGTYRSEDGGATWQYMSPGNDRPFYYSHIWFDPNDSRRVYRLATRAQVSEDGGRTWTRTLPASIDLDFHALWIDPANSNRFYVGNDKGASVTYDRGEHFQMFDNMDIGQYYAVTVDNRDPYWVYGGLQDNGNWGGPSFARDYNGILNDHWFKFHSGDGFHTTVDPTDWRIVYTETQGGNLRRLDALFRQQGQSVTPGANNTLNWGEVVAPLVRPGRNPVRRNWSTPFILSPHDARTIYYAANFVFKSTDRGDSWRIISGDLTTNDSTIAYPARVGGITAEGSGAEQGSTSISIAESPIMRGLLWVGTDDGNVQLSRDDGRTWTNVRPNIPTIRRGAPGTGVPARTWVSRVEASHFDPAVAYVSFDGHRSDDFRPYVWRTGDYGRTWTNVAGNLPAREPVYVVKEDLKNPNLLFAGTEFGAYASLDAGQSWRRLGAGLPTVAVHDLVIHPRDNDLIAATHGRSIWILDDITPLQQLTPTVLGAPSHLFEQKVATQWRAISRGATRGDKLFQGRNPLSVSQREPANSPSELQNSALIHFHVASAAAGQTARIEIGSHTDSTQRFTATIPVTAGLNRYLWPMRFGGAAGGGRGRGAGPGGAGAAGGEGGEPPAGFGGQGGREAAPGTYRVVLTIGTATHTGTITVRADPGPDAGAR